MKKVLKKIMNAILSVVLVLIILFVYAGIHVELSEQLSYAWLAVSIGAWIITVLLRKRKKKKNTPEISEIVVESEKKEIVVAPLQENAEQKSLEKRVEEKPIDAHRKEASPKDESAGLKKERLANCIYDLVVIDFETTGLNSDFFAGRMDEILSVAIIDQDGNTLLSTLCSTSDRKTWKKAEEIHGITPAMVKGKPTFSEILPQVKDILYKARKVIAYNIPFEMGFLWSYDTINNFPGGTKIREMVEWGEDPMLMYAAYKGQLKWPKLSTAARHFKFSYKEHDALEDVKATLHVYKALVKYVAKNEDKEYILKYGKCYKKPGD